MSFKAKIRYLYSKLTDDQKRAVCLGDVDLDDLVDDELTIAAREKLMSRITAWGRSGGVAP